MTGRPVAKLTGRPSRTETRWDGELIRVWLPRRSYRPEARVFLSRGEAEALVRNLQKRLAERPQGQAS